MSEERALIERAAGGEREALDRLAAAHRPSVLRTATHLLGDAELAEDVTQDAFVRLQGALPGFRAEAELATWLYRVTLNLCRDQFRKRRGHAVDINAPSVAGAPALRVEEQPERNVDAQRTHDAVRAAVARLPDDQREAVMLRYISDLTYAEIADVTGVPMGTVASRVFRALQRLGEDLESRHLELVR